MNKTNTDNRTEERKNRFNGESIMLTKQEASRHDKLFLCEIMATRTMTPIIICHIAPTRFKKINTIKQKAKL